MKKLFIILFIMSLSICANATTVLYRISSGEVMEISTPNKTAEDFGMGSTYFGVLTDPPFTDGTQWLGPNYENRLLGYSKINDNGTIRNATQQEIDTFKPLAIDDRNQKDADKAKEYFKNDPEFRRIMIAFADVLVSELNILRTEHGLNDRTLSQLKTAILNRISKDD
jgi:hypothetical protein